MKQLSEQVLAVALECMDCGLWHEIGGPQPPREVVGWADGERCQECGGRLFIVQDLVVREASING